MSQDPKHGGTNADGSKSNDYCSYCYRNGTWMLDLTVDQMQERVGGLLKQKHVANSVLKMAVAAIPTLRRWN